MSWRRVSFTMHGAEAAWLVHLPNNNSFTRSPQEVTERLDRLIKDIRDKWHKPVIGQPKSPDTIGDVLIVAHGHILRALAMRWAGKTLQDGPAFLLEAGGVGTLRFVLPVPLLSLLPPATWCSADGRFTTVAATNTTTLTNRPFFLAVPFP